MRWVPVIIIGIAIVPPAAFLVFVLIEDGPGIALGIVGIAVGVLAICGMLDVGTRGRRANLTAASRATRTLLPAIPTMPSSGFWHGKKAKKALRQPHLHLARIHNGKFPIA